MAKKKSWESPLDQIEGAVLTLKNPEYFPFMESALRIQTQGSSITISERAEGLEELLILLKQREVLQVVTLTP